MTKRHKDYKGALQPRKNHNQWIHCSFVGSTLTLKQNSEGKTTVCGKTAFRIRVTGNKDKVTCSRCIEKLKEEV